ncbi:hypothetical protein [Vibrio hyugaensis]|uniref:hypothetical protein n=1 Tax=Vibrio hyugaensis TaxID=1534743 RepID=UPI000CE4C751|nr:hypothetical protein [Vibrio hyugaensis]
MNKLLIVCCIFSIFSSELSYATTQRCTFNEYIEKIDLGYIIDGSTSDPDAGNAVSVKFIDKDYIDLDSSYNLNDDRGKGLYSALLFAMTFHLPVNTYSHHANGCLVIDEVVVKLNE